MAAIGSATVAVLSQTSGIERPFFALRRGHVVYKNCALYMRAVASTAVVLESSKREVCVLGTPSSFKSCDTVAHRAALLVALSRTSRYFKHGTLNHVEHS